MASLFLGEGTNKSPRLLKGFPDVWAEKGPPGLAKTLAPIVVDMRPGATPVRQKQYPLPREASLGIWDHIQRVWDAEILTECQSPWNTLLLSVKKSRGMTTAPSRTSVPSTMRWSSPIQWSQIPTLFWVSLLRQAGSSASILRMHSSASGCHQPASPCLAFNGKTHILGERHSWLGPDYHKASKTHLPCLVKPWMQTCCPSQRNFQQYPVPVCGWPVASQLQPLIRFWMASSGWYLSLLGQLNFFNPLDVSLWWEHTHYSSIQSLCNSPRRLLERCQSPVGSTIHHRVQGVMGKAHIFR